jgi:hypothetical protein
MKPAQEGEQGSAKSGAADLKSEGFRDEGRAARRERVREPKADKADGKRRASENRRDAGTGLCRKQTATGHRQCKGAGPLAEALTRDAQACKEDKVVRSSNRRRSSNLGTRC